MRGLTDEQAARRTTTSELCLAGVVKHVAITESQWVDFVLQGTSAMAGDPDDGPSTRTASAQHAGHADIIREALDGQETMG